MPKSPPIPPEQRSFTGGDAAARLQSARPDRRDLETNVQSPEPGDADVDTDKQGRYGALHQNLQPRAGTQDR